MAGLKRCGLSSRLTRPWAGTAKAGRAINFLALIAGAAESFFVEKGSVAAVGADQASLGHIGHRTESAIGYTVRTAKLFGHFIY
jgi:hypothetical protein